MATIEKSVDVDSPVAIVYRQCCRFEEYPDFMDEVVSVQRTGSGCLRWRVEIAGDSFEWDSEITAQDTNLRIAWTGRGQSGCFGRVTLTPLPQARTRIMLLLAYPSEIFPNRTDPLTAIRECVERGLANLKRMIEGQRYAIKEAGRSNLRS